MNGATPLYSRDDIIDQCRGLGSVIATSGAFSQRLKIEYPVSLRGVATEGDCAFGAYSYIGKSSEIRDTSMGRFCSVARRYAIGLAEHPTDYLSTHPFAFRKLSPFPDDTYLARLPRGATFGSRQKRTVVGNDVWLGDGVFVARGVTIGDGAIVAARAVVTKDVAPFSIVAGVGARHIRFRFPDDVCRRLAAIRWWDRDLSHLDLDFGDVESCLDTIEAADPPMLTRRISEISKARGGRFQHDLTGADIVGPDAED